MNKLLTILSDRDFSPKSLSNLQNWFDSADLSTITSSLNQVNKWEDKSGNLRHATQNTANLQPLANTSTLNRLNIIDFDSIDDQLDFDNTSVVNSEYTIFIVTKANSLKIGNWIMGGYSTLANQNLHMGYRNATTLSLGHYGNDLDITIASGYSTNPRYLTFKLDSVGKSIRGNGILLGYNANATKLTSNNNSSIGKILNVASYDGNIAEIIIYNKALSISEVILVEKYLSQKWGI